jgi:hypothetical protein
VPRSLRRGPAARSSARPALRQVIPTGADLSVCSARS